MITYHDATLEDLPFIVDVYNSTIAGRQVTADTVPVSVESRLEWFYQHNPNNRPLWLIKYQDKPCGWISLSSFYGRPAFYKTVEISLYLHQDFRGKKIGQFMVDKIEQFAKQAGIEAIFSYVFRHNLPSVNLFKKMQYQQWGLLPKIAELDNVQRDLVILGKRLD
ncbi:MAG: N-acetyltransferase [Gilliamella sp.]|uniref:GNAT family N-acetyltransferase n=1 Tax=Gilliamella TaxID=1193503 RepID=UPI000A158FBC|nr:MULTISPECIES: GNAT family N-acetyltransferase [Gilliamella]MCO6539319.1 N-acetyltransferase [Gilliamella sp.]MCO6552005.1 N-acetyltransferase [Gilliamella sp.]MCO6555199.1 N-acetyltransferase [Gilliamella sp.]MCO6560100.1 N-acetyltransferase [Gilliamella sp.]NUE95581.1 N-acetyltransferase [Gilliamella sp. ESL0232]